MKLPPRTPLLVSLQFDAENVVSIGRLALDGRRAVLEPSAAFDVPGFAINPLARVVPGALDRAPYVRAHEGLHGVFSDSLPDAWGQELMRRRASAIGYAYDTLTALDKLAAVGRHGMGAFVYEPALYARASDGDIDLDVLAGESREILAGTASDVSTQLRELGASSGGARPKVLVAMNAAGHMLSGVDRIPPDYEAWLVKFPNTVADRNDIGPLEAAYADMARAAGLVVAETKLIDSSAGGPGYFATKRFDRAPADSRVHMLSAAGALDLDWAEPGLDYDLLLKITRYITRDERAVLNVFRRMVFNVVALNHDDHAKQHAFLMDRNDVWKAAPSYDLTYSHGPNGEHYLAINGEGKNVSPEAIRSVAHNHDIAPSSVLAVLDEVCTAVRAFRGYAETYGVTNATLSEVGSALDASVKRFTR